MNTPRRAIEVVTEAISGLAQSRSQRLDPADPSQTESTERQMAQALAARLPEVAEPKPLLPKLLSLLDVVTESVQPIVVDALVQTFDRIDCAAPGDELSALLAVLEKNCPPGSLSAAFLAQCIQANQDRMKGVYQRILRSVTQSYLSDGTVAKCPGCGSPDVYEGPNSIYEFTHMVCRACGRNAAEDEYGLEDWYPIS